jgi:hypothetical protein
LHGLDSGPGFDDCSHDLVTGNQGQLGMGQFAIDNMQVGAAETAGTDFDKDLTVSGHRIRDRGPAQWASRRIENHGPHTRTS